MITMYKIISSPWIIGLLIAGVIGSIAAYILMQPKFYEWRGKEYKRDEGNQIGEKVALLFCFTFIVLLIGDGLWQSNFKDHFNVRASNSKYVTVKKEKVVAYQGLTDDLSGETATKKIDKDIDGMLVKTASGKNYQIETNNFPVQGIRFQNKLATKDKPAYEMTLVKVTPREQFKSCRGAHNSQLLVVTHNVPGKKIK